MESGIDKKVPGNTDTRPWIVSFHETEIHLAFTEDALFVAVVLPRL